MPYDHDYVCMMKQPVLCELCNKSYAIGVMKKHKQSKMHIENAKNHGVPSSWWFVGGTKPDAFVSLRPPIRPKARGFIKPLVLTSAHHPHPQNPSVKS